eukprot:CAMPEP_0115338434 /NCGR_PEP_ID=MMETSP0270-20121206/90067_1 /TAXON_ID=71861 /ORGANISM="Scrippsiella trochoidea, Strain CCMP3099" /LENGTH=133 /DNA_ID=CAMNT_0002759733 /DNA_START=111 /DNA_END=512 /DNA_ORIENTATION=-
MFVVLVQTYYDPESPIQRVWQVALAVSISTLWDSNDLNVRTQRHLVFDIKDLARLLGDPNHFALAFAVIQPHLEQVLCFLTSAYDLSELPVRVCQRSKPEEVNACPDRDRDHLCRLYVIRGQTTGAFALVQQL